MKDESSKCFIEWQGRGKTVPVAGRDSALTNNMKCQTMQNQPTMPVKEQVGVKYPDVD